jgi:serine/threonine protein kinase
LKRDDSRRSVKSSTTEKSATEEEASGSTPKKIEKRVETRVEKLPLLVAGVRAFTKEELAEATANFSDANRIGRGGYGKVYFGKLQDGMLVAVKVADPGSVQGAREFYTEIAFLSRVHHKNLVMLVGYCDLEDQQMLVYEFMSGGTLRDHLFGTSEWAEPLDFPTRVEIALGSARGINYLHTEANPPIFHRDIKASNILLDHRNVAKVADFGLSCLAPVPDMEGVTPGHVSTVVRGTPGYLDPEYYMTNKLTDKSDVYSFGVVLLELLTGMHAITRGKNIVREVKKRAIEGNGLTLVDPLISHYTPEALEAFMCLALRCVKEIQPEMRPTMGEVVSELERLRKCYIFGTHTKEMQVERVSPLPFDPLSQSSGLSISGAMWSESTMNFFAR